MAPAKRGLMVAGVALSAILIGLFASRLQWQEFAGAFAGLAWSWVAAACVCLAATMSVRALRWFVIARAGGVGAAAFWDAAMLGYAANALYPGRAGELVRMAMLRQSTGKPLGRIVATAMADRLADVVVVCVVAVYLVYYAAAGFGAGGLLAPVVIIACLAVLALVLAARYGARLAPLVARAAGKLPGSFKERVPRWYAEGVAALAELAQPSRLIGALALTAVACAIDYAMFGALFAAFGWALPLQAAMTAAVLLAIGSLVPAAPGYVGIYQAACVIALKPYGIAESSALALSVVAQGAMLLIVALLGSIAALRHGASLRKIARQTMQ